MPASSYAYGSDACNDAWDWMLTWAEDHLAVSSGFPRKNSLGTWTVEASLSWEPTTAVTLGHSSLLPRWVMVMRRLIPQATVQATVT